MSMNHEVRISALESRVAALEKRLELVEVPSEGFHIRRTFQGRFNVFQGETQVNTEPLLKADAEKLRDELIAA